MTRLWLLGAALFALGSSPASAEGKLKLLTVPTPEQPALPAGALAGSTIYVNPCIGGCVVHPGPDDATTDTSQIAGNQQRSLAEPTWQSPQEWQDILQCVKEVYSPFNVHITDQRPGSGTSYVEILVGGSPGSMGLPSGVGGIASVAPGCTPVSRGVSFAFPSEIGVFAQEDGGNRVYGMCWIIAQETAHTFGLDHLYEFVDDGRSACNDPMTYRDDCGGQKFFRNKFAKEGSTALCGTNGDPANQCFCGGTQNSHQSLLNVFGPGMSIVAPPTVSVTLPANNGTLGAVIAGMAGSKRGVDKVEFYLNNHLWGTVSGATFGRTGQTNPSPYQLTVPSSVPNSIIDIQMKAYDDLGISTTSATVTVTKGSACQSADTCLKGQKCESGKCFWDAPSGEIGADCTYNEFCLSGVCQGTTDQSICTHECIPGSQDSCSDMPGLECIETGPGKGVCFFKQDDGGCCSVGQSSNAWIPGGLGALLFGLIAMRPRRRK